MASISHWIFHCLAILLIGTLVSKPVLSKPDVVPNEYIVLLTPERTMDDLLRSVPGAKVLKTLTVSVYTVVLINVYTSPTSDQSGEDIPYTRNKLFELVPNVILHTQSQDVRQSLEKRIKRQASTTTAQCYNHDTGASGYWGLTRISQQETIKREQEHKYIFNNTGKGVTIYIMDTGVNTKHETFGGRAHHGFTTTDLFENEGSADLNGHGTAMASIAAGCWHGVAKEATLVSVKVLNKDGNAHLYYWIEGLVWIIHNITNATTHSKKYVINMSLGVAHENADYSFLKTLIQIVPAVFVTAAGNAHVEACRYFPALLPNVITVGGTNINDNLYVKKVNKIGSNYGPCVDILAPGESIAAAANIGTKADSRIASGTSNSAAFVSGMVARYLQQSSKQLTTKEMMKILQDNGNKGRTNAAETKTQDILLYYPACKSIGSVNTTQWSACADVDFNDRTTPATDVQPSPFRALLKVLGGVSGILLMVGILLCCIAGIIASRRRHRFNEQIPISAYTQPSPFIAAGNPSYPYTTQQHQPYPITYQPFPSTNSTYPSTPYPSTNPPYTSTNPTYPSTNLP